MTNDTPDSYQCYRDMMQDRNLWKLRFYSAQQEIHRWRWRTMTIMLVAIALVVALLAVAMVVVTK